jgi:hypothetical protein
MWGLGVNGREYTPADTGRNWTVTPILKPLDHLRDDFTIISGLRLTHSGGHAGDRTFLTGTATHKPDAKFRISAENRPHVLFDRLFRADTEEDAALRKDRAAQTGSVLDAVRDQARRLHARLGKGDQQKLDEYFHSIREVEKQIDTDLAWLDKPKPQVSPLDFGDNVQALDRQHAALLSTTDSTRIVTRGEI